MKPPKRLFRSRRLPAEPHDRRRVDITTPLDTELPDLSAVLDLSKHIVYVPVHTAILTDCYQGLRGLEDLGIRVDYSKGASAIDVTRNMAASDALRDGMDSLFFIDSDILFDPADAIRLIMSDAPVIAGVYAAKKLGNGALNVYFGRDTYLKLGPWAEHPYPCQGVGAGFLRIKTWVLSRMIEELSLPLCRMASGRGWPFFQPMIVEQQGEVRYLAEDYSFCHRCCQLGLDPLVDTSFRLYHLGDYTYGWEEARGAYIPRERNSDLTITSRPLESPDGTAQTVAAT